MDTREALGSDVDPAECAMYSQRVRSLTRGFVVRTTTERSPKVVPVELYVPESHREELYAAWQEIVTGKPLRVEMLQRDLEAIRARALEALKVIQKAIRQQADGEQCYRLTAFLASLYNGYEFPFDPCEFRNLGAELAGACLDYLNFDRLGLGQVQEYLSGGEDRLQRWIKEHRIRRPRIERDRPHEREYGEAVQLDEDEENETEESP